MDKTIIMPKVVVYHNMIGKKNKYKDFLLSSESLPDNSFFFTKWKQWGPLGKLMDTEKFHDKKRPLINNFNNKIASEQENFIKDVSKVFYDTTEDFIKDWSTYEGWPDYIKNFDIDDTRWSHGGTVILKNEVMDKKDITSGLAMQYHTDTAHYIDDQPGEKYAITCTIYINDDYDGGEISFVNQDTKEVKKYKPKAGDAVVFQASEPIYHAVYPIKNNVRYLIRNFWFWKFDGTSEWLNNEIKYGKDNWAEMEKQRFKEELNSGKHNRQVVCINEVPDPANAAGAIYVAKSREDLENCD